VALCPTRVKLSPVNANTGDPIMGINDILVEMANAGHTTLYPNELQIVERVYNNTKATIEEAVATVELYVSERTKGITYNPYNSFMGYETPTLHINDPFGWLND
jgi:hypothetical protein